MSLAYDQVLLRSPEWAFTRALYLPLPRLMVLRCLLLVTVIHLARRHFFPVFFITMMATAVFL